MRGQHICHSHHMKSTYKPSSKHQHQHQQNGSIAQNVDSEGQALAVHPSTKWVNCTECWFWRHTHINKSCHQKGQKQQMERQVSTIHINKFVDLPDGSTVQIVASGPLLTFLVIQKQQNGSRVLYEYYNFRPGEQGNGKPKILYICFHCGSQTSWANTSFNVKVLWGTNIPGGEFYWVLGRSEWQLVLGAAKLESPHQCWGPHQGPGASQWGFLSPLSLGHHVVNVMGPMSTVHYFYF